jgi:hypothetical protein
VKTRLGILTRHLGKAAEQQGNGIKRGIEGELAHIALHERHRQAGPRGTAARRGHRRRPHIESSDFGAVPCHRQTVPTTAASQVENLLLRHQDATPL